MEAVESWLSAVSYSHSQSEATQDEYKRVWARFCGFAGKTAGDILAEYEKSDDRAFKRRYAVLIREWIGQLTKEGLTTGSVKTFVGIVKSFFRYNDLPLGMIPQARDSITYHNKDIAQEEITAIMSVSRLRERAFYAVMAQSGLRPFTLVQLRMKHLESLDKVPCMITVPKEIAKGKYGDYCSFIGPDAIKHLKQYLSTRKNLTAESYVFGNQYHPDSNKPLDPKDISRTFKITARKLASSGALKYEVREGKPSEIRFYVLRKFFRKQAAQVGFENVQYLMGHIVKGSDNNYRPRDPEFYRQLYAEKAMPYLRLESKQPAETEKLVEEQAREIEDLKRQLASQDAYKKTLEDKFQKIEDWKKEVETLISQLDKKPRARPNDTIEDLHADGMVGSEARTKPEHRKGKT
jgi:site-specific recombinase XerD